MIRGVASHELLDVGNQPSYGALDPDQIIEIEEVGIFDGHESPGTPTHVPPKCQMAIEGRRVQRRSREIVEDFFPEFENALQARNETAHATHHSGL